MARPGRVTISIETDDLDAFDIMEFLKGNNLDLSGYYKGCWYTALVEVENGEDVG